MTTQQLRILVFSHRPEVRETIITAVGRRPAPDIGRVTYVEVATIAEVLMEMDAGGIDLAILDGEAQPTGGIGLCRQLKNEIGGGWARPPAPRRGVGAGAKKGWARPPAPRRGAGAGIDCPPIVIAVRRKDDRWLATWSQADAVIVHPLDPLAAAETVADVLRSKRLPVVRG